MGSSAETLDPPSLVVALHWGWVFQLLAITGSMLGKIAILIFLMQVRGRHASKPWPLIVLGVLILAVNITVLGTILGQCKPMTKLWDDSLDGTCDPGRKVNQNYSFFQASMFLCLLFRVPVLTSYRFQRFLRCCARDIPSTSLLELANEAANQNCVVGPYGNGMDVSIPRGFWNVLPNANLYLK